MTQTAANDRPDAALRAPGFRLDGLKALVTGASTGIGHAVAIALAEAGAHTLMAARRKGPMDVTVAALHVRGLSADAVALDITDRTATRELIASRGPFHILVNNAAVVIREPFLDATDEALDAMLDLNVRAAFTVGQAVAQGMVAAGYKGSIINIGSAGGHRASRGRSAYGVTKHAVEGLTKAMALELGPHGIRTNSVCPTMVATPMNQSLRDNPKVLKATEDMIPLGRIATVEDLMGTIVFLCSPAAAMINGASLMVDGGMTVR